jgi:hypothetical protein
MRPGKRRVLLDAPEGRLHDLVETAIAGTASACRSAYPHQTRASVSGDQAAVPLSENQAAGNDQESLHRACAGSPLEAIHGT